ncbi:MAG: hypothetical protein H8E40_13550 [Chloroflexi bacterium]|nr:hypothetical protein [Chloroflexota bacterium]MBL7080314.1 hypothetical protein [Candidatus Bathyarchaeota archaeon]
MRKSRSRVLLVELVVLCFLVSALGVSALAGDEYQFTMSIESPEEQSDSYFGFPVDVYGDIMVIGESWAYVEDIYHAGRAHIFDLDGNLKVTLHAPAPQISCKFGSSVAISGDIILVGEPYANIGDTTDAGRAHIFNSDGSLHATIQSPTPTMSGVFGWSLCFSGDTIVVGEYGVDVEEIPDAGKVHLYDSDGNYLETLQSPEPSAAALFGYSLDGSEGIFVVGEQYAKVGDTGQAGKAYIFDSDGDLLATLQSPEPQYDAIFGRSVAVSGDIVVVGEYYAKVEGLSKAGRTHIFDTDGNLLASLQSPEPEASAMFGRWVDTSGDLVLVAEPSANGESIDEGRAYVFDPEGNLLATLSAPEPALRTEFGNLVFVKGEIIAVMEYGAAKVGKLYIFQPGAADFTISGLTIEPSSVNEGGTVTVSVECSNEGSRAGSHTITLEIDGEIEDEKTVTLDPDESTSVSFEVSAAEEGSHSVDVNGLTGSYEVKKAQTGIPGFPLESIIAGLAVAIIVLWLHQRTS